ncbi:hypothetical protein HETIRDRAFT_241775, partial [Heterobasidion irregulare TC 32-1]
TSPKKKPKRGYAPPETYAHLAALNDYLAPGLDVVFCGINPGYMSAERGHHFCNPTNHFYRCLHASGFTPTRIPPTEDHTLPERFNLGLTNLVERPSTEAGELSPAEMAASVPALLTKIAHVRPRIVCFVGMGIARVVLSALRGQAFATAASPDVGLQPFKLVYHPPPSETLFFVSPSTSGRVTRFQATDKEKIFRDLKDTLEKLKTGALDTSRMAVIDI